MIVAEYTYERGFTCGATAESEQTKYLDSNQLSFYLLFLCRSVREAIC